MTSHWTDALTSPRAEDDYAHLPFGDNVHVRRLADAERCLSDLHFAVPAVEAERQALLRRISAIFSRMSETQVSLVVAGSWNAGKSTVINAFLGERWMPMNVTRETVTVNRILAGRGDNCVSSSAPATSPRTRPTTTRPPRRSMARFRTSGNSTVLPSSASTSSIPAIPS